MDSSANQSFARLAAGDRSALEQLLERYLPTLHAYVRVRLGGALEPRESTMDVVQSVCRQVLSAEGAFRFVDEDHFRAWLFSAAVNKLREKFRYHRGQRRAVGREERALDHEPVTAAAFLQTPSAQAIGGETAAAVTAALATLSDAHREVLTLARLVKLPHRAIAELMGRTEPAVRQLLVRATLALAEELERRGIELEPERGD
ncbi:MAG: sigma-70 family RNA polymerase sigma factor [Planctomycetes bacterium]|nr:sigma-70 family RNA polymerase sigma factor [Planctomycetota bacterium]